MDARQIIASRFEIRDLIGQGGMGEVFYGLDTQTGQRVAIKRIKPEIVADDPDLVRRFEREGEALRKLNHPNIVKMFAAVEEDGRHYLIMEYVGGGSLDSLMDDQPQMPINRVLDIALDLADALTRAHRLKIVHRDIKPANVLLAEDGTPRLTDFGVAYMEEVTRVTQSGMMIGTYAYLSPEGCNSETVDERSDIWSFGVMLYEMLAGRRPFDGETPAATLTAILTKPAPDLRALRPDTSPALVSLISKMLEKERDQRIPSVRLVGAELEAMIRGGETPRIAGSDSKDHTELRESRFSTPTPSEHGGSHLQLLAAADGEKFAAVKRKFAIIPVLAILALAVLVTVLVVMLNNPGGTNTTSDLPAIVPVAPGEYMVLVGQIEHLGGEEHDVTRFIVDNLVQALEVEVPFSNIRVRQYPQVITSAEQARAAAEAAGATIVIWGNYNAEFVELEAQLGSIAAFPSNGFSREILERTGNVRVRLTNERAQSAALAPLTILNILQMADGNLYEAMRTAAINEELAVNNAEIIGNSVAAHYHRAVITLFTDVNTSFEEINAALALDGSNPLPYFVRSLLGLRRNNMQATLRDAETAQRLGPENWVTPLYALGAGNMANLTQVTDYYGDIVALRPDDWFPMVLRGGVAYFMGGYDQSHMDFQRAIELDPDSNLPYIFAAQLALRQGRVADAAAYFEVIVREYPDPTFSARIFVAAMGETAGQSMAQYLSISGNLALGQYDNVVTQGDAALGIMNPTNPVFQMMALVAGTDTELLTGIVNRFASDVDAMYGLAQCNLRDFTAAEAAYTNGLEADPSYALIYLLRAEVRLSRGNDIGAQEDFADVEQSELAEVVTPYVASMQAGDLNCTNLLSTSNPVVAAQMQ
jgi:serine/threonine protein kinase/tetratricopeptide (TPR) repeat protein